MKKIGIVICNYNKCDYVLKCIQSVLESRTKDFDIYVVDNASTDASVARIREQYKDEVTLLVNDRNLGGSGGFNTGIRKVAESGYEYLMCLDNDVRVDENAVEALYTFLENHPDVGMVGSKVYHLHAPEYIQQFGLNIDFDQAGVKTLYADTLDTEEVPEVVYCDTVAACSVMLPVKVVRAVGGLPEDNFLYWDDMEWGVRIKQAGYQVAACGKSMVLHEMGAFVKKNSSFITYYHWRNCLHFFMKYTPQEKLEAVSIKLLSSLFRHIYESMYREEHDISQTILYAFHDAMSGIRDRAAEGRILPFTKEEVPFARLIKNADTYWMGDLDPDLENCIRKINPSIRKVEKQIDTKLRIKRCKNILELKDYSLKYCYVDDELNIAANSDDIEIIRNYSYSLGLFLYMNQKQFLYTARQIREK